MICDVDSSVDSTTGKKRKITVQTIPRYKKKIKKSYCYCGKEAGDSPMVLCSGGSRACLKGWYHIACVEKKEKIVLERSARGGVTGDFICALCKTAKTLTK